MRFPFFRRSSRESLKELSVLFQVSQALAHTLELSELLNVIRKILTESLQISEFKLFFFTGSSKETLELVSDQSSKNDSQLRIIPLMAADEPIGELHVGRGEKHSFSGGEIQLLESVANQVAIAYSRSKLYMKTKELSVTDELTGVFNRRHFGQALRMEWKRASRFDRSISLLMIDVDHFKSFNDRSGHLMGDKILKELASLLLRNIREVDTVARFGGEEFVIILADTDWKDALTVGEKLRALIETGDDLPDGKDFEGLTVSIGVSSYPEMADSEEELINTADLALYQAKESGRNRVIGYEVDRLRENRVRPLWTS